MQISCADGHFRGIWSTLRASFDVHPAPSELRSGPKGLIFEIGPVKVMQTSAQLYNNCNLASTLVCETALTKRATDRPGPRRCANWRRSSLQWLYAWTCGGGSESRCGTSSRRVANHATTVFYPDIPNIQYIERSAETVIPPNGRPTMAATVRELTSFLASVVVCIDM